MAVFNLFSSSQAAVCPATRAIRVAPVTSRRGEESSWRRALLTAFCSAFLLLAPATEGFATTLTFEGQSSLASASYGGLVWSSNSYALNASNYISSGYYNGRVSADYVAYNGWGDPMSFGVGSGTFSFVSAYFTAAWYNGLNVRVVGKLGGNDVYERSFTVDTTSPTLVVFNFTNIDTVSITTSGGTHAGYGGSGRHLAIDDLTFALNVCPNGVPEPGEACDDGASADGDGCSSECTLESGYECSGTPSSCATVCGDSLVVGAETCDDGNADDDDGCSSVCDGETGFSCDGASPSLCSEICGDGLVVGEETCDDEDVVSGDGCSDECIAEAGYSCSGEPSTCNSTCGDGIPVGAEECDDGDLTSGDGCTDNCIIEPTFLCSGTPSNCVTNCGNGAVDAGEDCDDLARDDGDGCSALCLVDEGWGCAGAPSVCAPTCGDGQTIATEECDDGNEEDGDCCSSTCAFDPAADACFDAGIGESISGWFSGPSQHLTAGWAFDVLSDSTIAAVGVPDCGSGLLDPHTIAIWDETTSTILTATVPAGTSATLVGQVRYVTVPPVVLEAGHRYVAGALYPQGGSDCIVTQTPDNIDPRLRLVSGREIFSPVGLAYPSAPNAVRFGPNLLLGSDRGDGTVDPDEDCDDGNVEEEDGCSANGEIEAGYVCSGAPSVCESICGDSMRGGPEECDDGNATAGDGCSDECAIEAGYNCLGEPSVCTNSCGDGAVDGGEVCDDGNLEDDDGCTSGCRIEPSYTCTGAPSSCTSSCGDGVIDETPEAAEECDDGNLLNGDCCSAHCRFEPSNPACHVGLSDVSGGGGSGGVNVVEGWEFTVSEPVTVSAIGVLDEPSAAGFGEPHEVAIWNSSQQLLTSGEVPAGTQADLVGEFRYVPVPAVVLQPGQNYTIGALFPTPRTDTVYGATDFELDPRVTVVTGRRLPFVAGLVYPTGTDPNPRIGPTMLLSLANCGDGDIDANETCDDSNLDPADGCSEECQALCAAVPRTDCRSSAVSKILVKDDDDNSKDMVSWKWLKGEATLAGELSDPTSDALYHLCLYPDHALQASIFLPAGSLWESQDEKGFTYDDDVAATGGVSSLRIKAGVAGKASVSLKSKGANVPEDVLATSSYAIQLSDAHSGTCWSSDFASGVLKAGKFRAKTATP